MVSEDLRPIFMKLLTVMQRVDEHDEMLGAFYVWLKEFAKCCEKVTAIAGYVGKVDSLPANVEVYSLGKERGASKAIRIKNYLELFSKEYHKSDAVLFQMCPEFVIAASPFLVSLRRPTALWYSHVAKPGFKARIAERLVDFVFTPTEYNFKLPSKKVIHTGHAIDTELFRPAVSQSSTSNPNVSNPSLQQEPDLQRIQSSGFRMLVVGRIAPVKNLEIVIRACRILKDTWQTPWSVSIVGGPVMPRDYEYTARLKRMVAAEGLSDRIVFMGPRSYMEMPSIYRDHDIFLSMTGTGSFDRAMLEAMSSGLSVLTPNRAFRPFIKSEHFLEYASPEFLAERIKLVAFEPRPQHMLRENVMKHHGIENTLKKILLYLNENRK